MPKGPLWSKLQHGQSVILPNGRVIKPEEILGPPRLGRKIVYSGDTKPSEEVVILAENADLLIHDATFDDELKDRAYKDGHSTPTQAATIAKKAGVKMLALTHISARYEDSTLLLEQAKKTFPNVVVAEDYMKIDLPFSETR